LIPEEIWVIDTCSVIQIRRIFSPAQQRAVYEELTGKVESGTLVYPKKVVEELERNRKSEKPDPPYEWAHRNEKRATRHGPVLAELKEILAHPQVRNVFDPNKSIGVDEADPHVLALAQYLKKQGALATVITEETRNRPDKLSMNSACGLLRLFCLPIEPYLREQGLWPV
jgi:hypothetical protein